MTRNPDSHNAESAPGKPPVNLRTAQTSPEWRATWLRCVEAAHAEWERISYNDLALSGGDPRKLVTLLERHYDLADGEAWRKVEAFLRQCQPRV